MAQEASAQAAAGPWWVRRGPTRNHVSKLGCGPPQEASLIATCGRLYSVQQRTMFWQRGTRTVHWGKPARAALGPQANPSSGATEGGQHDEDTVARSGTRCVPHSYSNCAPLFLVLCGAYSVWWLARLRLGDAGGASVRVPAAVACARCGALLFGGPGREGEAAGAPVRAPNPSFRADHHLSPVR